MAITRARKQEFVALFEELLQASQALVIVSFQGITVPEMEQLRKSVRESGGRFMVVKNTLFKRALTAQGLPLPEDGTVFEGPTAVAFALQDPAATAKAVVDFRKGREDLLRLKAGYLDGKPVAGEVMEQLAKLPPLPVLRAQLLGTIMAPATRLVRVLAEPGRQLAAVVDAYRRKLEEGGAAPESTAA
ncbi:MAG: 50S ribosomal protein L10 [Chloroflexi bacterium]|nr:50S ribosomal protein L10 [Chloroflexota bacterium]